MTKLCFLGSNALVKCVFPCPRARANFYPWLCRSIPFGLCKLLGSTRVFVVQHFVTGNVSALGCPGFFAPFSDFKGLTNMKTPRISKSKMLWKRNIGYVKSNERTVVRYRVYQANCENIDFYNSMSVVSVHSHFVGPLRKTRYRQTFALQETNWAKNLVSLGLSQFFPYSSVDPFVCTSMGKSIESFRSLTELDPNWDIYTQWTNPILLALASFEIHRLSQCRKENQF